jgi:hypothetical protein
MCLRPTNSKAGIGVVLGALLAATLVPLHRHFADAAEPRSSEPAQPVEARGRVVCLAEEMHRAYQVELPTGHPHLYGFKTEDGMFFTLLRNRYSEGLFADQRLREKELILKGRTFPKTQLFEVSAMRSVKNGVTNDLYYFCVICSIKAVGPGKCECCQDPVELVEKPLNSTRAD